MLAVVDLSRLDVTMTNKVNIINCEIFQRPAFGDRTRGKRQRSACVRYLVASLCVNYAAVYYVYQLALKASLFEIVYRRLFCTYDNDLYAESETLPKP